MIYLLPLLAVVLGYVLSLLLKPSSSTGFQLLLSFSGAFLLSVTVLELFPEVYSSGQQGVGLFIMLGLLLQILLEFLSKGVEHGHIHQHSESHAFPLLLLISLSLHSLLEGFPISESRELLHGVVIHKIPVAAILSSFLVYSKIPRRQVLFFLLIFGLMTPLGSWLHQELAFLRSWEAYIDALVIGVFLHVSTTILFEASKNHSFNLSKLAAIVTGIVLAYFL